MPWAALVELQTIRYAGEIHPRQKVLIQGASGGVGTFAVQITKAFGAEVTAVCSTRNLDIARSIGADHVIDYTREDFKQNGVTYDLIFDILGKSSFSRCQNSLKPNGIYLLASFKMKQLFQMLWTSIVGDKKVICALSSENPKDLVFIKELVEAGKIKSIIDRCYPLEKTAEAHRYIEKGYKTGSVIITMSHTNKKKEL